MQKLSLVMCVKDEEKGLEKAILSVKDFVDEIIISVDSISNDATYEIAKKYATVLLSHTFQDDFSKMRNEAGLHASGDWILFLDGHEYVTVSKGIKEMLESPADGLLCSVRMESGSIFRNPRLYKKQCRFFGAVHEKLDCKNVGLFSGFVVQHDRINGQSEAGSLFREKQRDEQTPRIFTRLLKIDPANTRALFHMGLYFTGTQEYKKAISFFKRYLKYGDHVGERWFVCFQISLCHLLLGNLFRAYLSAMNADREQPARWEIKKLKGLILFSAKKYDKALKYLLTSFYNNACDCAYIPWDRDDSGTWNIAGESFFNLGNFEMAGVAFNRANVLCISDEWKKIYLNRAVTMEALEKNQKM